MSENPYQLVSSTYASSVDVPGVDLLWTDLPDVLALNMCLHVYCLA